MDAVQKPLSAPRDGTAAFITTYGSLIRRSVSLMMRLGTAMENSVTAAGFLQSKIRWRLATVVWLRLLCNQTAEVRRESWMSLQKSLTTESQDVKRDRLVFVCLPVGQRGNRVWKTKTHAMSWAGQVWPATHHRPGLRQGHWPSLPSGGRAEFTGRIDTASTTPAQLTRTPPETSICIWILFRNLLYNIATLLRPLNSDETHACHRK